MVQVATCFELASSSLRLAMLHLASVDLACSLLAFSAHIHVPLVASSIELKFESMW